MLDPQWHAELWYRGEPLAPAFILECELQDPQAAACAICNWAWGHWEKYAGNPDYQIIVRNMDAAFRAERIAMIRAKQAERERHWKENRWTKNGKARLSLVRD